MIRGKEKFGGDLNSGQLLVVAGILREAWDKCQLFENTLNRNYVSSTGN